MEHLHKSISTRVHDREKFVENSYLRLFARFLRYGFLAWGGPIAQLALIEREMVFEEKILSASYFNRLIAIYQAFPGPETNEICVHLGTQAKGPWGGLLAGIGFMLPGFILMMILSWVYVTYGMTALATGILLGIKPAVIAWIIKGGVQLGRGILLNSALWLIAALAFFAELNNVHFLITFIIAGLGYLGFIYGQSLSKSQQYNFIKKSGWILLVCLTIIVLLFVFVLYGKANIDTPGSMEKSSALATFFFGLKCGSLSFGSVYTILSIVKTEAILKYHWLTQAQFIDGLALAGALPAPFIIVTTFVGYLTYGFWGGVLATIGTFLIPFIIPMFSTRYLDRLGTNKAARIFLDGVTAAVAGLITADIINILSQILISPLTIGIFIGSLLFIYIYKSLYAIIWIVLTGGILGAMTLLV